MTRDGGELRYERTGAAAVLTIDRPERRNAVDAATAESLREGLDEFEADDGARVLVLTGAGGEAFCAGADLKAMDLDVDHPDGPMGSTRLTPVEAGDRRGRRLVPGRRARAGALVRPADRDRRLDLRPLRAALGSAADRRRHPAPAAGRRHGPGAGADPHRPPGRGRGGAPDRTGQRGRRRPARTSIGRWSWPSGSPASRRRRCSPTAAPRSRASACRCAEGLALEAPPRRRGARRRRPRRRPLRRRRGPPRRLRVISRRPRARRASSSAASGPGTG